MRKVTSQKSKFAHLISALPLFIVDKVANILGAVPEHESYSSFKEFKRTGRLDEDLKRELFNNVTKYDWALSQLLRYMKNRLGRYTMAEPILLDLWLDCSPSTVTQNLVLMSEIKPLDQLIDSVDRIFKPTLHTR